MSDEQRKMVFDLARAGFYLVAAVIATHLVIVLLTAGACLYVGLQYNEEILKIPDLATKFPAPCANNRDNLMELLATSLAAALAYSGGRSIPKE